MGGLIQSVSGSIKKRETVSSATRLTNLATTRATGAATTTALAGMRALEKTLGFRFDAAPAYLFFVELSGVIVGVFSECSGIGMKREVDPVREGGVNYMVNNLPGPVSYEHLILKRGLSLSRALWDWFNKGIYEFDVKRINFSIIQGAPGANMLSAIGPVNWQMASSGYGKVKHWDVEDAFPINWSITSLNASSEEIVFESIEIVHHGISLSYEAGTPMSPITSVLS